MENERLLAVQAVEEAFQVIKAKHKGLQVRYASKSDPLLLELADMILLFSAQLTLAAGAPTKREPGLGRRKVEGGSKPTLH